MRAWILLLCVNASAQSIGSLASSNGFQTKTAIDIRDTKGIDCTGAVDSSGALNVIFASLTGNKVVIPLGCTLRADHQLQIVGQANFIVEGQGAIPNQNAQSAQIFGCGTATGPLLYINRSGVAQIKNFGVYPKGNGCTSGFTQSIQVDNSGTAGFTTTNVWFDGMALGTSEGGGAISGYVGLNFSGTPNLEQMRVTHSDVQCQFSPNSFGIWYNGSNADVGEVSSSSIAGCFQAIRVDQGNPRIVLNLLGNNGGFSHFGNLGAVIFIGSCSSGPMIIIGNEQSSGGPFINSNDTAGVGCSRLSLIANEMGADDLQDGAFVVNVGTVGGYTYMEGNDIYTLGNPKVTGVGSNSQAGGQFGPLGQLIAIANTSDAGLGFAPQSWQDGQFILPGENRTGITQSLQIPGGSANRAVCWKADGRTLGYCSSLPDASGSCTCN